MTIDIQTQTTSPTDVPGGVPTAAPDRWTALRGRVTGTLHTPEDAGWQAARTPWIVNVDQRPAAVLEVADTHDVVQAITWAADQGLAVAAQPGGHAPRATLDGTLLLRTGRLDEVTVDTARRTARVGAGVKWGALLAALDGTGLLALAGSNPDPTVVGMLLGGGASWFSRKHGFTANSVIAFDVVDACGTEQRVTRATDPELFWALRGGGGDFAVVTGVEIALFEAPALHGGSLWWPLEHAPAVLRAFRDLATYAPRELSMWAHISHFPPLPDIPEPLRGRSFVSIAATCLGTREEADRLLWSLRDAAPAEMDTMADLLPSQLGSVAAEPVDPMPALEHSALLGSLDDDGIDRLLAAFADPVACPLAVVQIRHLGGAMTSSAPTDGAVCPVREPFQLFALGVPVSPDLEMAIGGAFTAVGDAVGHLTSERRMPNFTGGQQADSAGYDATTLARLGEIKRQRDPEGVIRSNKPVLR